MPGPESRSLADFAVASGAPVPCAGNLPLDMGDPRFVWFVEKGAADVFLVERRNGTEQSAPQHLTRTAAGRLLPGVAPQAGETTLGLMAKGLPGTVLRRLPADGLAVVRHEDLAASVDAWIADVSAALSRDVMYRPPPDAFLETGQPPPAAGSTFSVRRGVAWARASASSPGAGLFMGLIDIGADGPDDGDAPKAIPLTSDSWLTLTPPHRLAAVLSSETMAGEGLLLPALANLHEVAFSLERLNRSLATVDEANLERARAASRRTDEEDARRRLFNLYGLPEHEDDGGHGSALRDVLRVIGRHEGIDFQWPARADAPEFVPTLVDVLDVSGVRGRQVRLSGEDRWWVGDSGSMLAFRADDGRPVALLPGVLGHYRIVDSAAGRAMRVTSRRAETLKADAWLFYRPLKSAAVRPRDLFRVAGQGLGAGFARLATVGLLGGLIALLPVMALGFVANRVIPDGESGLLYSVAAALAAFAAVWALMRILQGMALMRLEGRVASRIEAAFWDRLLRLPSGFLQRYPAGDRAMRGMTFQRVREAVQGVVANDVLSFVFMLPALLLIFFYDSLLGSVAVAFGLLALLATLALGLRQIRPYARAAGASRRLTGLLFQIINGISKLRIEGAEGSAFAAWARDYGEQQRAELELGSWEAHLRAFVAALPLLAGAVLLAAVALRGPEALPVGDFLVIYTAFMLFVAGLVRLGTSFGAIVSIAPEFAQIRPFLDETPESSVGGESVEHLSGDIAFDRVTFRYDPDGPLILDGVSIHARAGELIAIAGESGSGKSTLFRIALGLNEPVTGAVYYDGRDLRQLNAKQVRRKIGVVPQEVRLHPQDLWDNIAGGQHDTTAETVWQSARTSTIDKEISAMPMKMLTAVGDSGSVISGGESQRILIAQALMRNPRILLLDEATNWLDNESQSRVMHNLAQLPSTRIVIAHRLSTLRQVDRIYVMQAGRIVQEGTYAELAGTDGVFRDLVRRQEA